MDYFVSHGVPSLVAAIAAMIIGSLWYSPLLFAKRWKELAFQGRPLSDEQIKKDAPLAMVGMFVMAYLTACIMRYVLELMGASTAAEGATFGLWIAIGFSVTTLFSGVLFEKKPIQLFAINASNQVVTLVIMGAILGAWR